MNTNINIMIIPLPSGDIIARVNDRQERFQSRAYARQWVILQTRIAMMFVDDPCSACAGTGETERCVNENGDYDPEPCPDCDSNTPHTRARAREGAHVPGTCRCDGVDLAGSDHCPHCGCEEFEETCPRPPKTRL